MDGFLSIAWMLLSNKHGNNIITRHVVVLNNKQQITAAFSIYYFMLYIMPSSMIGDINVMLHLVCIMVVDSSSQIIAQTDCDWFSRNWESYCSAWSSKQVRIIDFITFTMTFTTTIKPFQKSISIVKLQIIIIKLHSQQQ